MTPEKTPPLCFVLMPFGQKPDASGKLVDFDLVYRDLVAPAIKAAKFSPLRADEEMGGGIIHKSMFERLMICEYAVADLSTANANVFYELGIRHAFRPWSTVLLFAEGGRLPFDVAPLRALSYRLNDAGRLIDVEPSRTALSARLEEARVGAPDSPVYALVDGVTPPVVAPAKTDSFRQQAEYSAAAKARLATARQEGIGELRNLQQSFEPIRDCEAGVVIDLFQSYRSVKAWTDMIALVDAMSSPLRETVTVQEQLGFALNRAGRSDEAETVLQALIASRGPSSETYGILGRVYKDRWEAALNGGHALLAQGQLEKAIGAYVKGFEADWRDAYPGVNAVTLMELKEPPDPRRAALLPIVRYSVERKLAGGTPGYWDYATQLELAVLASDEPVASRAAADALASAHESWALETTARNLRLIREARAKRRVTLQWATLLEDALIGKPHR